MMKKILGILVFITILFVGYLFIPNEISDRFNPLVPSEEIFVQIDQDGTPRDPGGYDYTLNGFNEEGEKREVTFYAGKKLQPQAFLKVYAKGSYVEKWEEVELEDLPEEVRNELN